MITPNMPVLVTTAGGQFSGRALSGVEDGFNFPVVYVCTEEEWARAEAEHREPEGNPYPAEDVMALLPGSGDPELLGAGRSVWARSPLGDVRLT
ncbi:MAG: hypothetical protein M0R75_13015 [Dehalococcoidia bacterium]|nr:hypothetical protein [Dehalococcoidia bacterium]